MHRACLARWHYRQRWRDERPSCPRCRSEVDAVEIRLKTLTGTGFLARVPSDATVRDLMLASTLHLGLSCEIQRLVYDGSQLDPDAPLPAVADDAVPLTMLAMDTPGFTAALGVGAGVGFVVA